MCTTSQCLQPCKHRRLKKQLQLTQQRFKVTLCFKDNSVQHRATSHKQIDLGLLMLNSGL